MSKALLVLAALAAAIPALTPAMAQRNGNYPVQEMNFDLWCQEQAGLPVDRCDKRQPDDVATFEAYRAKIERYEIPYLQQKSEDAHLDRVLLHNDPVDRPLKNDPAGQRQDPNQPPAHSPP